MSELKEKLSEIGLETTGGILSRAHAPRALSPLRAGKKAELVARLVEHAAQAAEAPAPEPVEEEPAAEEPEEATPAAEATGEAEAAAPTEAPAAEPSAPTTDEERRAARAAKFGVVSSTSDADKASSVRGEASLRGGSRLLQAAARAKRFGLAPAEGKAGGTRPSPCRLQADGAVAGWQEEGGRPRPVGRGRCEAQGPG